MMSSRTGRRAEVPVSMASVAVDRDWRRALDSVLSDTSPLDEPAAGSELALLFASTQYTAALDQLLGEARRRCPAQVLIGASSEGVIGGGLEVESGPGLALARLHLPGAALWPLRLSQATLETLNGPDAWHAWTGIAPSGANGWIIIGDASSLDVDRLLTELAGAYPGVAVIGGLIGSGTTGTAGRLFLDDAARPDGAILLALGGAWSLQPVLSQGCTPIGEAWTITGVRGRFITTIGNRPAYDVLVETVRSLPADRQRHARHNLLIGLAADERREQYGRGDFLVRSLAGVDRSSGALAIGSRAQLGQTVQFQLRDGVAADEDLRLLLDGMAIGFDAPPVGALLCACNGRGAGLFGAPNHDAAMLGEVFDGLATAGFFSAGEIGPIGRRSYLHSFAAAIGLFVPAPPAKDRRPPPSA
jgi:small ligand-binding sensory domain FIST